MSEPDPSSADRPGDGAAPEIVSVQLKKLRVSRIKRVSEPSLSEPSHERPQQTTAAGKDDDDLARTLRRLHVVSPGGGGRHRTAAADGCRRRPLLLRPSRLKPSRRPLLRQPRLLRSAAAVFGADAPQRCSDFGQVTAPPAAGTEPAAGSSALLAGAGSAVFPGVTSTSSSSSSMCSPSAEEGAVGAPTVACSVQHRQRRPVSVDELAGLVSQVNIMSSMAEMMYT